MMVFLSPGVVKYLLFFLIAYSVERLKGNPKRKRSESKK
jgi:hypothetical protein